MCIRDRVQLFFKWKFLFLNLYKKKSTSKILKIPYLSWKKLTGTIIKIHRWSSNIFFLALRFGLFTANIFFGIKMCIESINFFFLSFFECGLRNWSEFGKSVQLIQRKSIIWWYSQSQLTYHWFNFKTLYIWNCLWKSDI